MIWRYMMGIWSFLLDEFFFDRVRDAKINFQNLLYKHLNNFLFIAIVIFLNFGNLFLSFLLKVSLEFFISFLLSKNVTSAFIFSNSCSFSRRYLAISCSATSLASLSFRCLHKLSKKRKNSLLGNELIVPLLLSVFDDLCGFLFSL